MRDRAYISIFIFATLIFIASIILTLVFVFQEDKIQSQKKIKIGLIMILIFLVYFGLLLLALTKKMEKMNAIKEWRN